MWRDMWASVHVLAKVISSQDYQQIVNALEILVNKFSKRLRQAIGTGRCSFCNGNLELSVAASRIRIFRCRPCGLFGQSLTPPIKFRPRPTEKRRKRKLW